MVSREPHSPRAGSLSTSPCLTSQSPGLISSRKPKLGPSHPQLCAPSIEGLFTLFLFPFQNTTLTVEQESFSLKVSREMGEFCIKVKPLVETRNNRAEWSEEQCLHLAEQCEWPRLQTEGAGTVQNNPESNAQGCWCPHWAQSFYIEPSFFTQPMGEFVPFCLELS